MTYSVIHTNCDGAGTIGTYQTRAEAIAKADELQAQSDAHGNPYGYTYHVFESCYGSPKVYETRSLVRRVGWHPLTCPAAPDDAAYIAEEYLLTDKGGRPAGRFFMLCHPRVWRDVRFETWPELVHYVQSAPVPA